MHDVFIFLGGLGTGVVILGWPAYRYIRAETEYLQLNGRTVSRRQWRKAKKLGHL